MTISGVRDLEEELPNAIGVLATKDLADDVYEGPNQYSDREIAWAQAVVSGTLEQDGLSRATLLQALNSSLDELEDDDVAMATSYEHMPKHGDASDDFSSESSDSGSEVLTDGMKAVGGLITHFEEKYDEGAPIDVVLENANKIDMNRKRVEQVIEKLKQKGEVYEPTTDHLRMAPDYDTPAEMDERDHSQREPIKNIKQLIADIEQDHDNNHAPIDVVIERAEEVGMDPDKAGHEIEKLKQKGEVYNPPNDSTVECLRTT